tara:strand:+ start:8429 stop:8902 length:474 start_codon:yes stop_codon:yes gene_type:complete
MLEYARVRKGAHPPERANPSDAGLDLYFNPEDAKDVTIEPGTSAVLATGCRFGVPHGYMLEIKNRSSVAAKRSLIVGACVVDSGYDGEVFVNLHNIGREPQTLSPQDKIAQAVMVPVVHFRALETHSGDLYGWYPITMSGRGDGALGSTDGGKNEKA